MFKRIMRLNEEQSIKIHFKCKGELLEKNGYSTWKVFRLSYVTSLPLHISLCSWFKETLNTNDIKNLRTNCRDKSTTLKKVTKLPEGDFYQENTCLFESLPFDQIQESLGKHIQSWISRNEKDHTQIKVKVKKEPSSF